MSAEWSFYGRQEEAGQLLEHMRKGRWFFGSIRGRRRIGKTALINQVLTTIRSDDPSLRLALLFQLPDSSVSDTASVFRRAARRWNPDQKIVGLDDVRDLEGIATVIGSLCHRGAIVVIDEFQYCYQGPLKGFPSLLQAEVDRLNRGNTKGGLIVVGSIQTEMEALLEDRKAPLFGRTTFDIRLGPWDLKTIFEVSGKHGATDPQRRLTLWTLFGGVPRYWELFAREDGLDAIDQWDDWATELCNRLFLSGNAPLSQEGETLLGGELRRNYLAILHTLARRGPCSHAELLEWLPDVSSLGAYLEVLVKDLRLVEKSFPVFAEGKPRNARYAVSDPFLRAWLAVLKETRQDMRVVPGSRLVKGLLSRLQTLEGHAFEVLVRQACEEASRLETGDFSMTQQIHGYWNRPRGGQAPIEIDLVAQDEHNRKVRFGSCKRTARNHDRESLKRFRKHVANFLSTRKGSRFRDWKHELALFAPSFPSDRRSRLESDGWICRDLPDLEKMLRSPDGRGDLGGLFVSPKVRGEIS